MPNPKSLAIRKTPAWWMFLAIAGLVCLLYAVDYTSKLGGDYSFYFSNGWFLQHGLHPYVDFWTHKPPLLVWALAAWIGLFGASFYSAVTFLIVVTILCSYCVVGLAAAMGLGPAVSFLSGALFALIASMHWLDPDRNGVIIIFASIFELLSLIALLRALRHGSLGLFFAAGVLVAAAVAARQTSLPVYLVLIGILLIHNGRRGLRKSLLQGLVVSLGCALAGIALLIYLAATGASLRLLWDQLVHFNVLYAAHFWENSSILHWLFFWLKMAAGGFLLFVVACFAYVFATLSNGLTLRSSLEINPWLLLLLFSAHAVSILLARFESPYYGVQMFPELAITAAIVIMGVLPKRALSPAGNHSGGLGEWFVLGTIAVLLAVPIGQEVTYAGGRIRRALAGGYLIDIRKLPWYSEEAQVAERIDAIAPNQNDRIWLLQYGHDTVYVTSDRLPALTFTQGAGLTQPEYSDDAVFTQWYSQFLTQRPKVVVFFPEVDTSNTQALQRIRAVVESSMRRVDSGVTTAEIFQWK